MQREVVQRARARIYVAHVYVSFTYYVLVSGLYMKSPSSQPPSTEGHILTLRRVYLYSTHHSKSLHAQNICRSPVSTRPKTSQM